MLFIYNSEQFSLVYVITIPHLHNKNVDLHKNNEL